MRDCTRYTINAALHVVSCVLQDALHAEATWTGAERSKALDTVKVINQLRDEWSSAPDMARREG